MTAWLTGAGLGAEVWSDSSWGGGAGAATGAEAGTGAGAAAGGADEYEKLAITDLEAEFVDCGLRGARVDAACLVEDDASHGSPKPSTGRNVPDDPLWRDQLCVSNRIGECGIRHLAHELGGPMLKSARMRL